MNRWTLAERHSGTGAAPTTALPGSRGGGPRRAARDRIARRGARPTRRRTGGVGRGRDREEKFSTDAADAARRHSGALDGIGLCQVTVHLTYASRAWHALTGRALYLTRNWTTDDERRELTGLPYEPALATKP
ncbi:transposase [Streptomyces sp. NPDC048415]|uniref:transposase n=1 Tax=Streptomyces sp. NPDC048415 TaxID=3154822 RepID=UPI00341C42FF